MTCAGHWTPCSFTNTSSVTQYVIGSTASISEVDAVKPVWFQCGDSCREISFKFVSDFFPVREVKLFDVGFVLTRVRNCIALVAHPFIHVRFNAIFDDPNLGEDATELPPAISFRAPEFNLDVVLFGLDRA